MAEQFDLDAKRAARFAAKGTQRTLVLGGNTFTIPIELPLEVGEAVNEAGTDMGPVLRLLLGEDQWAVASKTEPKLSNEDVMELLRMYGDELGEFAASTFSSRGTGEPSRPTSPGSTDSTSASAAGVNAGSVQPS